MAVIFKKNITDCVCVGGGGGGGDDHGFTKLMFLQCGAFNRALLKVPTIPRGWGAVVTND